MSDDVWKKQLIHNIGGKQYLLFETIVYGKYEDMAKRKTIELGGIVQGMKDVKIKTIGESYGTLMSLIPVEKINEFQEYVNRLGKSGRPRRKVVTIKPLGIKLKMW